MPELPEAETIVRGLRTTIVGESIRRVEVLHLDILRQTKSIFSKRVRLRRINEIERRGKNVLLVLNGGWVIQVAFYLFPGRHVEQNALVTQPFGSVS